MISNKVRTSNQQLTNIGAQGGWTMWSMMFVMGVVFIAAYILMQLVPIYSGNESVKNAMYVSLEDKNLQRITRARIVQGMQNQLYLDGSSGLFNYKKDLKMTRSRNTFTLEVAYQREVPLVANLVLVAKFNPKVECDLTGRCEK